MTRSDAITLEAYSRRGAEILKMSKLDKNSMEYLVFVADIPRSALIGFGDARNVDVSEGMPFGWYFSDNGYDICRNLCVMALRNVIGINKLTEDHIPMQNRVANIFFNILRLSRGEEISEEVRKFIANFLDEFHRILSVSLSV